MTLQAPVTAIICILALTTTLHAQQQDENQPTHAELEQRITALEQQIAELKQQAPSPADAATTDATPILAGYDDGFFLTTEDGNYLIRINGLIQPRYTFSTTDRNTATKAETSDFELRRTRIKLSGHAHDPRLFYELQGDFRSSTGDFRILDAYLGFQINDLLRIRVGQWKHQFQRETIISATKTGAVDRSMVANGVLPHGTSRIQGVEAQLRTDTHRLVVTLNEGYESFNTSLGDNTADVGISSRYEFKPLGDWSTLNDFTAKHDDPTGLLLAIAGHAEEGAAFAATSDITLQLDTATTLHASIAWHEIDDAEAWGVVLFAAQRLNDRIEPFLRAELGDDDASPDQLYVLTVGSHLYLIGNNLKLTTDLGYAFDAVPATFSSSSLGWATDDPGQAGQTVFRMQLQFLF
jgi:hypothetical protein